MGETWRGRGSIFCFLSIHRGKKKKEEKRVRLNSCSPVKMPGFKEKGSKRGGAVLTLFSTKKKKGGKIFSQGNRGECWGKKERRWGRISFQFPML